MRVQLIHLLTVVLLGLSVSTQASISLPLQDGSTVELYDKSYALLIGVSDYEHWPDLPGVEDDIEAVGKGLKKHGFKVISLLNPTRDSFDDTMRDFIGDYGQDPENRLIIYYAGHGYTLTTNRGRELGYIVPANTPLPKDGSGAFKKKAISMLEIEIFAKQMESKHAMFAFDSCFSGSLFEITRAVPDTISLKTSEPVRQFITAGSAEQTVPDKSVFRNQFVAGLEGEADINKDGFITGTELAQYIEDSVTNYTRRAQTPQYGKIRDPYLDKGDFVFINPKMEIIINVPGKETATNAEPREVDPKAIELSYWDSIKDTRDPEIYQAYLDEYPDGQFSKLAGLLIKQAGKQEEKRRAEKLAREEERRYLAEQRQQQADEFEQQQALLEQQRRENVQRMAKFREEQAQLVIVNTNANTNTPPIKKSVFSANSMSVAILTSPGNLIDDHHFDRVHSNEKMAEYMGDTLSGSFDKALGNNNKYIRVADRDRINSIIFESDDYAESKRVCTEYKVEKVFALKFNRNSFNGDGELHLYDCVRGIKVIDLVSLTTSVNDKYYLEISLKKALRKFYRDNTDVLQPSS